MVSVKRWLEGITWGNIHVQLDKNNAEHCKHVVDDYYMPAFEFLKKEVEIRRRIDNCVNLLIHQIDPHMICNLVGLCPAGLSNMIFRAQVKTKQFR